MRTIVNNLNGNPIIALAYSAIGIATGTALHFMRVTLGIAVIAPPHETLDLAVKYFQIFAYAGGGIAGFVAGHGWLVKRTWYQKVKYHFYKRINGKKKKS